MTIFQATAPLMTRPATTTQYAAGDLVADNVTAGSVIPLIFPRSRFRGKTSGRITGAGIVKSTVTATDAQFRLHLFNQAKTLTNGDNGALVVNDMTGYIGAIDVDMTTGGTAISGGPLYKHSAAVSLAFNATGNVYGYLEQTDAQGYVPASAETFLVTIDAEV